MSCTERQAVKNRCCGPEGCGLYIKVHRDESPSGFFRYCIGSNCMAWRWTDKLTEGPDAYRSEPGPTGYCGLAGIPECAGN